jgi:hypothetical protein
MRPGGSNGEDLTMTAAEDFLLLAVGEGGGPLIGQLQLGCGLAAAVLVELADAGRLDIADGRVVLRDPTPLGTPDEDAALAELGSAAGHDLQWWLRSLRPGLYDRILARQVARGVVTLQRGRLLGIVPAANRPVADAAQVAALRERLSAVLDGQRPAAGRDVALLAIAHATTLDRAVFPALDVAAIEGRIVEAGEAEAGVAQAVTQVVRQLQAAMIAAMTAAL